VRGVVTALGLQPVTEEKPKTIYRVQVGAFPNLENAEQLKQKLIDAGFPAFIKRD
jgi:cell division septation protein DedD